jgi:hypothetical protein
MIKKLFIFSGLILLCLGVFWFLQNWQGERALREIIKRLEAETRIAQAVVAQANSGKITLKFVEFDTFGKPLPAHYFTFSQNIIQFQSLVIRFADFYIRKGDALRGKSAYLFLKAFALKDKGAEVYEINRINEVPEGYRVGKGKNRFEERLWRKFWQYALDEKTAAKQGIKSCQIEAPGTKFVPGILYTLKIEHDGGIRIETQPIPEVLR